jgi:hypothetical protein
MLDSESDKTPTLNPMTVIPRDLKPGDRLGYKIIAVIGYTGDWAAYKGLTSWSDDEVARNGDKLSKTEAEEIFYAPHVSKLVYRR